MPTRPVLLPPHHHQLCGEPGQLRTHQVPQPEPMHQVTVDPWYVSLFFFTAYTGLIADS